jgi:hypothetical protein
MLDKLDCRVSPNVPLTREFEAVMRVMDEPQAEGQSYWRPSKLYTKMGDLRPFGIDAILHRKNVMTKVATDKLEILGMGEKTLGEVFDICRQVYQGDPEEFGILRADWTADQKRVPVWWFKQNVIVDYKKITREIGNIPQSNYMTVANGICETLYAGKKPRQVRIYDKTGERIQRWKSECLRIAHLNKKLLQEGDQAGMLAALEAGEYDQDKAARWSLEVLTETPAKFAKREQIVIPPTFTQMFGYSSDEVITRVESQYNGKGLEQIGMTRVHNLWRMAEIEPFTNIRFPGDEESEARREDYEGHAWAAGLMFGEHAKKHGLLSAKRLMTEIYGSKNLGRNWSLFQPFMTAKDRLCTYQKLQAEYVRSSEKQLYAA